MDSSSNCFFGIGEGSKIALISIAAFVLLYLNTAKGIRETDQDLIELALVHNKRKRELVSKILIPSSTPFIFTGLKIALGLSWILLIASELIASTSGLGWLIWDARNFARPDDMIAGMIIIGILGALTEGMLNYLEKRILFWKKTFQGV